MLEVIVKLEELMNVEYLYMDVELCDKVILLCCILYIKDMCGLVFVKDKLWMEILLEKFYYDKVKVVGIYGEICKEKCKKYLDDFKKGMLIYLIVIDVVVCGLDIEDLFYVIYYDLVVSEKEYMYCFGWIGWMGKLGMVIIFVNLCEIRILK